MHGIGTSGRSKVTALMSGNSEQLETYTYSTFCTEFLKKKLETYSYFSESFFGYFSKKPKKKYFEKSWKRTQIWKKIRKLLETYTDFYEKKSHFFWFFLIFFQKNQKKNILKNIGSVHRFGKKSENYWRRTQIFMKIFLTFSSCF
jgi:hypothetical protein